MNSKVFCFVLLCIVLACSKGLKNQKASTEVVVNGCNDPYCIVYDLSSELVCVQITSAPTRLDWGSLASNLDIIYLKRKVYAYQIQWSGGNWSGWYIPGVNDIDWKFSSASGKPNGLRKVWAYFSDHTFKYIAC